MIGQLLHSLSPRRVAAAVSRTPLDSVTEDSHTTNLLFPDAACLRDGDNISHTFPGSPGFGLNSLVSDCGQGDIDLEYPRDIRILVAQGESGASNEVLLFDSKPSPPLELRPRHVRSSSRNDVNSKAPPAPAGRQQPVRPSQATASIPESPDRQASTMFGGGAFAQRARSRRTSVSTSTGEDASSARHKDSDEVVKIALECMFENASSSYKGTSNKIHIVPLAVKPFDHSDFSSSLTTDFGSMSLGARPAVRRPSTLSKSHTPGDVRPDSPKMRRGSEEAVYSSARRRTVLVTRTFSVSWSMEEPEPTLAPPDRSNATPGQTAECTDSQATIRPARTKFYRSPMYAITVVLQLPVAPGETTPPPSRGVFTHRTARKGSGSHPGQVSLGSSYDSERRAGWAMCDPLFSTDSSMSLSFSSDVDDRVDLIGQHWDIIMRTLSGLQSLVQAKILEQLKPLAQPRRAGTIKLPPLALVQDQSIKKAAADAGARIVRGIKIPRVKTGQGRWGIWRDEARWLGRWAGGKEENFFFYNLITAFLGTHTDWLSLIGPKTYRRHYRELHRKHTAEDIPVASRTIIVAADKMVARRLVFLLSAFLPANHPSRGDASPLRPSTSASFRAYSQSPPSHMAPSRQESLRRTINRRGKATLSGSVRHSSRSSFTTAAADTDDSRTETGTIRGFEAEGHHRQGSESKAMLRSKLVLNEADAARRKSSAATASTVTPDAAVPVAHIAFQRQQSSPRMSLDDSPALENMRSTFQRCSTGNTTPANESPGRRWGSLKNLWSGMRRESATEYSDVMQTSDEALGVPGARPFNQFQQMTDLLDETKAALARHRDNLEEDGPSADPGSPNLSATSADQAPSLEHQPAGPIDVPLKVSVNQSDGVIDVEIPFPDFGSPMQSPPLALAGYASSSSFGESSFGAPPSLLPSHRDSEHPLNVAGWLQRLHPDFSLQAVKPYPELVAEIKAAMSAEPNPHIPPVQTDATHAERWVDVCTTLIADAATFSIRRLRLRRLVRISPTPAVVPPMSPMSPGPTPPPTVLPPKLRSQYGNPYSASQLAPGPAQQEVVIEERFEDEPIMDMDSGLVDVIERILEPNGSPVKGQSGTSSRSSSRRGRTSVQLAGAPILDLSAAVGDSEVPPVEVSRGDCKKLVLGALEEIAAAVAKERKRERELGGGSFGRASGRRLRRLSDEVDSTLREGIKKWFEEVEASRAGLPEEQPKGHLKDPQKNPMKGHVKEAQKIPPNQPPKEVA
ncbi:hypothetical protein EJ06DRAFT_228434 [Trichodelitschia bisporula]|uniref:Folliculin-interacting protein N-terminal domain-containing protein n=1 Tax=Trichodelitschia bisporula TaxID=703511 RepID=A0A6G1HLL3_9PEZI|nr:hypothetical protein EJ06DRAFT_228434 [Trichodelitschia bisporula]